MTSRTDDDRFVAAITAIDAANADDPHMIVARGVTKPKEQAHAELMTEWVRRLDPDASEEQLLAARAHHLRRWALPRSSYPDGRTGYLRWRTAQKHRHAEDVAAILAAAGYEAASVERVQAIVRKDGLRTDPAVQTHEDALCLVFLETQFQALADDLGDDKTVDVLRKTIVKMSDAGIEAALGLDLDDRLRALLGRAAAPA